MSASQNARDREHLARVRKAAPKLLEACVVAHEALRILQAGGSSLPYFIESVRLQIAAAIAATQPPAKRKEAKP